MFKVIILGDGLEVVRESLVRIFTPEKADALAVCGGHEFGESPEQGKGVS
jgi:hypothetical protein